MNDSRTVIPRGVTSVRRARRTAGLVAGLLAFVVFALGARGAAVADSQIAVSPSSAPQGGTVTISGNVPESGSGSCAPGDPAQLTSTADLFPPDGFGPQAARDASGAFRVGYTIPTATAQGSYNIGVRCGGGNVGVSATLRVTPPVPTTTAPSTTASPATVGQTSTGPGATTAPPTAGRTSKAVSPILWIVLGVLALLVGVGAALLVRRRRGGGASN
jgi:hypothetical protein